MAFSRTRKGKRQKTFFIAEATAEHEGSLRAYVLKVLGEGAFENEDTKYGKIDPAVVRRISKGQCLTHGKMHVCPNETTQRRARLALTLAKIRARRKSK